MRRLVLSVGLAFLWEGFEGPPVVFPWMVQGFTPVSWRSQYYSVVVDGLRSESFLLVAESSNKDVPSSPEATSSSSSTPSSTQSPLELELQELQQRYMWIEALEERNAAQLPSFIDEQHQWESLEPEEQLLLQHKPMIEARMQELAEQLIQLWMGQKSRDG
jgi:hypothetical protein